MESTMNKQSWFERAVRLCAVAMAVTALSICGLAMATRTSQAAGGVTNKGAVLCFNSGGIPGYGTMGMSFTAPTIQPTDPSGQQWAAWRIWIEVRTTDGRLLLTSSLVDAGTDSNGWRQLNMSGGFRTWPGNPYIGGLPTNARYKVFYEVYLYPTSRVSGGYVPTFWVPTIGGYGNFSC